VRSGAVNHSDKWTTILKCQSLRTPNLAIMFPGTVDKLDMMPLKLVENEAWPRSHEPLNFRALNANSSKTAKALYFKFGVQVPRDRQYSPALLKNFLKGGHSQDHMTPKNSHGGQHGPDSTP